MVDATEFSPMGALDIAALQDGFGASFSALKIPATRMLARYGTGRSIVSRPSSRGALAWPTSSQP